MMEAERVWLAEFLLVLVIIGVTYREKRPYPQRSRRTKEENWTTPARSIALLR
jgi:hypothetical protein